MAHKETAYTDTSDRPADDAVAEFLDVARSANVHFDLVHDRLHMRMVNPDWTMWSPIRHLLDEIGVERIEAFVRRDVAARAAVERSALVSAERLHLAAEAMRLRDLLLQKSSCPQPPTG